MAVIIYGRRYIFLVLTAVLLLVSACGSSGGSSGSQTGLQVLEKSVMAMKQLKAAHLDLKSSDVLDVAAAGTPTTGASGAHPIMINLMGNGDEVLPAKFAFRLTFGQGSGGASNESFGEIILGRQVFIENPKGQWYVLAGSRVQTAAGNPFAGTNVSNYNALLVVAEKAQISDHGDQMLNGQSLRHISASFGKDVLKDLLNVTGQLSAQQQQDINKALNAITLQQATLDVWIDEATSYVHRLELKFTMSVNVNAGSGTGTPTATAVTSSPITTSIDTIIDYSKFNESVTIAPPAHAIPTDTLVKIFEP